MSVVVLQELIAGAADNLKDFNEIHRFCSLRIKSGNEFFFS